MMAVVPQTKGISKPPTTATRPINSPASNLDNRSFIPVFPLFRALSPWSSKTLVEGNSLECLYYCGQANFCEDSFDAFSCSNQTPAFGLVRQQVSRFVERPPAVLCET